MIYVTHDQTEAMTLADRIVVLRDGVIEQYGTPAQIYDVPCNRFVAGFMGSPKMSFIEAVITDQNGTRLTLQIPGTIGGHVELELERPIAISDSVTAGIRPEHFNTQRSAGPRLQADVEFVERLGSESFLHAPAHPAGALIMRQNVEESRSIGPGKCEVGVDWRRAHLFARDGKAIPLRRETESIFR
jgi:ABC-type sugar transport system ATPase subunit